jgi:predicted dehydrogenase
MKRPIQLGLIGCGWVSNFYGQTVQRMPDRCAWAWATDPDEKKARAFCNQFGGEPRFSHAPAKADAYIIATPHHLHAPQYLEIAATGAPVLIEKPLALTLEDCDRMIAARDQAGGMLMVGYVNRYRNGPRTLKAAVERGDIGKPLFGDIYQFASQEKYIGGWILKRETLGGGCFFSSAGHLLDLLLWFHGPVERMHVELARYRLAMEGEDTALATVRFRNGFLATLRESWCSNGSPYWQSYTICGTTGTLQMTYTPRGPVPEWGQCPWDTVVTLRRDGAPEQVLLREAAPFDFKGQFEHFIECIETGRKPLTDAESAREVIREIRKAEEKAEAI